MNEKEKKRDEKFQEHLGSHMRYCYFLKANIHTIFSFEEL